MGEVSGSRAFQIGSHNVQTNVDLDAGSLPPPQRPGRAGTAPHNLPPASAVFEGRDLTELGTLLGELEGDAEGGVVAAQAAVHGLGGTGKSELANQYARAHLDRYDLVWWITAETRQSVGLGLAALTARLHPVATLADAQEWAVGWLQSNTGWLLVLDNVDDVAAVTGLLGLVAGRGRIVVTTRRDPGAAGWRKLGLAPLRLDVLDRPASVRLLLELTGSDDDAGADVLAGALGDLPLGLQQAAAYVSRHDGMTFDDYVTLLTEEFDRAALHRAEGDDDQRTIAAVWTVTMASVAARSPLAAKVLDVLAWLAADPLPKTVLEPLATSDRDLDDALALLASYSMIARRSGAVTVHRLVQAVTRAAAATAGSSGVDRDAAIKCLVTAMPPEPATNVAGWSMWAALLPHVEAVGGYLPAGHRSAVALKLQDRAATYQQYQGNGTSAVATFERVLLDTERLFGAENRNTLAARSNLAFAYVETGRLDEAIALNERNVADCRRLLGDDHAGTLTVLGNLATCYLRAGDDAKALEILERLVVDRERIFGVDHRDTLSARSNLAASYERMGRVQEAFALREEALADLERNFGSDDPDTLKARGGLGVAYWKEGRTGDAIVIFERIVEESMRVLGPDKPDTLTARSNLGVAYSRTGRVPEAITILERVLDDLERVRGSAHPDTLTVVSRLAEARAIGARGSRAAAPADVLPPSPEGAG
ncbi:tetratricopeptide repeat protein [Paractinoplanes maris]|uniref:tetratricopeptide repeat protein n=1 Tax=Paractinoplanes maris TaxID=1734446 RepID=UPI0020219005|nr:tetratricopeptide repeat protein [Actinoplanes maris]